MISILFVFQHTEESFQVTDIGSCLNEIRLISCALNANVLTNQWHIIILRCRHDFFSIFVQVKFHSHSQAAVRVVSIQNQCL